MKKQKWGKAASEKSAIFTLAGCEARQLTVKCQLQTAQAVLVAAKTDLVALLQPFGVGLPAGIDKQDRENVLLNLTARAGEIVDGANATIYDMDRRIAESNLSGIIEAVNTAQKEVARLNALEKPSRNKMIAASAALSIAQQQLLSAVQLTKSFGETRQTAVNKSAAANASLDTFPRTWGAYETARRNVATLNGELQFLVSQHALLVRAENAKVILASPTQEKVNSALENAQALLQQFGLV